MPSQFDWRIWFAGLVEDNAQSHGDGEGGKLDRPTGRGGHLPALRFALKGITFASAAKAPPAPFVALRPNKRVA